MIAPGARRSTSNSVPRSRPPKTKSSVRNGTTSQCRNGTTSPGFHSAETYTTSHSAETYTTLDTFGVVVGDAAVVSSEQKPAPKPTSIVLWRHRRRLMASAAVAPASYVRFPIPDDLSMPEFSRVNLSVR
jgi:hypothetical protein